MPYLDISVGRSVGILVSALHILDYPTTHCNPTSPELRVTSLLIHTWVGIPVVYTWVGTGLGTRYWVGVDDTVSYYGMTWHDMLHCTEPKYIYHHTVLRTEHTLPSHPIPNQIIYPKNHSAGSKSR